MKRSIVIGIICVGFVVAAGAAYAWYQSALRPVSQSSQEVRVVVPKGANSERIGKILLEEGLIRSEVAYKLYLAQSGLSRQLQAGSFTVTPSLSTPEIVSTLTQGTDDIWITVIEGWRREEIAQNLENTITSAGGNFNTQTFLSLTEDDEGYLFPDTYLVPIATSEESIVNLLKNTLDQKITPKMTQDIQNQGKNLHQILTMASIIEREANTSEGRRMVSGILWSRIENGMPLQVDATLQYIKGYSQLEETWWPTPYAQDKELESPYNTYKYAGLPPTPISTSSIDSIEAAIYPTPSSYVYYITGNDGQMYYATTYEEHNININRHLR